jgi:predicted secreted Zn-dependent protease
MATYIEYQLEDGTTILVEADQPQLSGVTKASRDKAGNVITSVNQKFEDAFAGVKKSALVLRRQLEEMRADEVEVTFGLKATSEAGNFAIGKVGMEANYTVTLKWSDKESESESERTEK